MTVDILNLVKSSKVFSSLDDSILKDITKKFVKVYLRKGHTLFHQGDYSDGMYLLVSGTLIVKIKTQTHEQKAFSEIHAGETVGELGALSQEPRTSTVVALEDSILLKLPRTDFCQLIHDYPSIVMGMMELIVNRSRSLVELIANSEPAKKHIALVPANEKISLQFLSEKLQPLIAAADNTLLISDYDAELHAKYATKTALKKHIEKMALDNKKIIYILGSYDSLLTKICFETADMVYVVGDANHQPTISARVHKKLTSVDANYKSKPEFILLHENPSGLPKRTSKWLKLANFGLNHHVRLHEQKDLERLLRFMRGKAIGVVLGGGGVRSWAHIGALKALTEAGIPIDAIGGTSGGSIVGGYYALNETYLDPHNDLDALSGITYKAVSLKNLTWPAISLFDTKDYTEKQMEVFGEARIENLWLPFFCVTCNLAKSNHSLHRTGYLWKKIRASTAVPGLFPPMVINGQIHLDGGIVNNLPVDLMKKLSPSIGTVIAIELIHNVKDLGNYHFSPILPFWKVVLAKLKISYKSYRFPPFVDTFLRALLVGSSVKQKENARMADILVSPDLSEFDLLKVTAAQETKLIDIGYKATMKAIRKWKRHKEAGVPHKRVVVKSSKKTKTEQANT